MFVPAGLWWGCQSDPDITLHGTTTDSDEAYIELGMGNTQGELTPLGVGLHAYGAVELGKGGSGQVGDEETRSPANGRMPG